MYKRNSKILAALLTIVLIFSIFPSLRVNAAASGTCGDPSVNDGKDVTWTLDDAGVLTISGTGAMADYEYYKDPTSGEYRNSYPWYEQKDSITKVVIEEGVTSVGVRAFSELSNLESVTLPDSLTVIGDRSFSLCSNLSSINLPNNLTLIDEFAFYECSSLTNIVFPSTLTTIGKNAFERCYGLTEIDIPDSVTTLGVQAFSQCTSLKSATLSNQLTELPDTFHGCAQLTTVTIPDSVTTLDATFYNCTSLSSITIPDSVTTLNGTFFDCTSLTSITIPDSVTSIGEQAFYNCTSLESITIPDSVTSIGDWAFSYCTSLTNVTMTQILYDSIDPTVVFEGISPTFNLIPSGYCGDPSVNGGKDVTWIFDDTTGTLTISGTGATAGYSIGGDSSGNVYSSAPWFAYKDSLTKIIIENGVTSIGGFNFAYLSNVVDVTIPNSVTSIGYGAFNNCTSLTGITIPDSVTSIGDGAFAECTSLSSITIPDSVTSIGNGTFTDCTSLTSITIPDSVTSIGIGAFDYCTSLTSITIPDTVTSIGINAFYKCTSLTSITIPDSVISIGNGAFEGCTSLETISIPDSVTTIGYYAFEGCTSLKTISIPDSVTSIGNRTFTDCTSLTSITIPDSVQNIGVYAFRNCTSLTDVAMSQTLYDELVADGTLDSVFIGITLPSIHFSYTVDYKSNGNGTITGTTKSFGTDQIELTIQPDSNYELDKIEWSDGTNSGVLTETSGKYVMPDSEAGAVTLTATFNLDQKTVTFKNEDGTVLQSGIVDCGTNPAYTGTTPTKSEDDQYTYTFTGWSDGTKTYGPTDTLPAVTDDATYTAVFDSTVKQYTIKFVDEDGSVLQSGNFDYGTTPVYTGTTPTKAEDDKYTYTFSGWTPAIASVTGNATYTATFTETAKTTTAPTTPAPTTPAPTTPAPVTAAKPGTYYLSSMAEKDGNIVITIKMSEDDTKTFDLLGTVTSDGVALTEGNQYTAAKGSAIITINKSFLDMLSAGTHKLTVTFTDGGSITIDYEVKAPAVAPQAAAQAVQATGEAVSAASIAGVCLILAAAGIAFTVTRKRKEEA